MPALQEPVPRRTSTAGPPAPLSIPISPATSAQPALALPEPVLVLLPEPVFVLFVLAVLPQLQPKPSAAESRGNQGGALGCRGSASAAVSGRITVKPKW